jgi:hypothetical protein
VVEILISVAIFGNTTAAPAERSEQMPAINPSTTAKLIPGSEVVA